jgi:dienelactone hydrolase
MTSAQSGLLEFEIKDSEGLETLKHASLRTSLGDVDCVFYNPSGSSMAVLWSGSLRGQGDVSRISPIAQSLSEELLNDGVASLVLKYRHNGDLSACIKDAQAGVSFLERLGFSRIALVGHSFSGAVVISVAPFSQAIVGVVALASQTMGAQLVRHINPRPILLVHGTADQRLNCFCSEQIYSWALKPKNLVLLEGASHGMLEKRDKLLPLVHGWLLDTLGGSRISTS